MNRVKYRICLLAVIVLAAAFGIWFFTLGEKEEQEPFSGATLVYRVDVREAGCAGDASEYFREETFANETAGTAA